METGRLAFAIAGWALAAGRSLFFALAVLATAPVAKAEEARQPRGAAPPAPASEATAIGPADKDEASASTREELPATRVRAEVREDSDNPFRQSALLFDQSMTTQTVGFGPTPQSYVPLYELWLSFRPRYYFDEHWSVRGRFDYTKELTNNQPTTMRDEDVFGDIWTDLVYGTKLDPYWRGTRASIGVRALWPTSKISQGNGTYVTLGTMGGVEHRFVVRGESAPVLNDFRVGLSVAYLHPFAAATTPTSYGGFAYTRQNVDGRSFTSDEVSGQTLSQHVVWAVVDTGLQITPRLSLMADLIFINQWRYAPADTRLAISNASLMIPAASGNQFVSSRWFIAQFDYDLFDELSLSLGYYNLTNALGPDGQTRSLFGSQNIWWSPDARFFFDVTANLDVLFDDARRRKTPAQQARAR